MRVLAVWLGCLLWLGVALGQPSEEATKKARALFDAATVYYQDKDYEQALRGYQDAYKVAPLPFILFNIAQCYRFLERYQEAHDAYTKYLRDDPSSEYRAEVEEKIALMSAKLAEHREVAPATSPATVPASLNAPGAVEAPERPSFVPVLFTAIPAVVLGSVAMTSYSFLRDPSQKGLANGLGITTSVGADVLVVVSLLKLRSIHKERSQ